MLLGGPFAAAVVAKGITASTAAKDPTAKPSTDDMTTSTSPIGSMGGNAALKNLTSNDDGSTSMADTQYVIFSLIAMAYFLGAFIGNVVDYTKANDIAKSHLGLPSIPSALLGLTSLAALTYVGNKAAAAAAGDHPVTAATQGLGLSQLTPPSVVANQPATAILMDLPATATTGNLIIICTTGDGKGNNLQSRVPVAVQLATGTLTFIAPDTAGKWQVVIYTVDYSTLALPLIVT